MSFARLLRPRVRNTVLASAAALTLAGSLASCNPVSTPQTIAKNKLWANGWGTQAQYNCLNNLWTRESGWNPHATNPHSGAYGIPQALPASKLAASGPDWQSNPATQITWGLNYIRSSYGSPCGAWAHSQAVGWY